MTTNPEPAVEPGPELALPDGVQVIVARDVLASGTDLSALCRGAAGQGARESTEQLASDVAVSRGRVTQPGDYSTSWEIATVLHERGDGSVVRVQLEGSSVNVDSTPQLRTALAGWLDDVLEDLVAAATTEGFKTEEGPG